MFDITQLPTIKAKVCALPSTKYKVQQIAYPIMDMDVHFTDWPFPPFPLHHVPIHPKHYELEAGLLRFFFSNANVQITDQHIHSFIHYDSLEQDQKYQFKVDFTS